MTGAIYRRRPMGAAGWAVYRPARGGEDAASLVGFVEPFYLPSHIRRGRMQTEPWWKATTVGGVVVDGPDRLRPDRRVMSWATRREAAEALLAAVPA